MSFELRAPTPDDAQAVIDLIVAFDTHFGNEPEYLSVQDVLDWWESDDEVQLALDGRRIVAQASVRLRGGLCYGDVFVHPNAFGRGVGTRLAEWAEGRARSLGAPSLALEVLAQDERAGCLLRSRGYERIRSFFRMLIDLDGSPPAPDWPTGVTVSKLEPDEEPVLHEVLQDAFVDHWRSTPRPFDEWMKGRRIEHDVCFLARSDGEVAAAAACRTEFLGMGWIDTLGTRRPYRGRGLGEALLRHSFRELYARGARRIGLGVDAENPTGATRLYERVGMRVAWAADVYERVLDS